MSIRTVYLIREKNSGAYCLSSSRMDFIRADNPFLQKIVPAIFNSEENAMSTMKSAVNRAKARYAGPISFSLDSALCATAPIQAFSDYGWEYTIQPFDWEVVPCELQPK